MSSNNFSGIWSETTPEMTEIADKLGEEKSEKPAKLKKNTKKRSFGIASVIGTLLFFVFFTSVVTGIYAAITGETDVIKLTTDPVYLMLSMVSMHISWIAGAWVSVRLKSIKRFLYRLKFRFKKYDIFIGLGYAAAFFAVSAGISTFLTKGLGLNIESSENTSTFTQFQGIWLFVFAYGFVSIIGPAVEELFFRGYITQAITNSLSKLVKPRTLMRTVKIVALIITSTIFGMFHFQGDAGDMWWVTVLVTGCLGLFMGTVSLLHKRLGPAVFGHIFYNCTAITLAIYAQAL